MNGLPFRQALRGNPPSAMPVIVGGDRDMGGPEFIAQRCKPLPPFLVYKFLCSEEPGLQQAIVKLVRVARA